MKAYRFLLFDADHTLLDFDKDMDIAFQATYQAADFQRQMAYTPEIHQIYERCNNHWWGRFERRECSKNELYVNRFRDFLKETSLTYDPAALNELYFENLARTGTAYDGAVELMKSLSQRYDCYIITNGNAYSQPLRLKNSRLDAYYHACFVSEGVGVGKPDLRYFRHVADSIPGFSHEQALVVGDSLSSDIQGAVNAGLDSIWYNPRSLPSPDAPVPTYTVRNYPEILSILE